MRQVLPFALGVTLLGCSDQGVQISDDQLTVTVLSHRDGDVVSAGVPITFRGVVGATESRPDEIDVAWFVNDEVVCLDEPDDDSLVQCQTALPAGEVTLRLEGRVPRDEASDSVMLIVEAGISAPEASIDTPAAQSAFAEGSLVLFEGVVSDAETLPGELVVQWSSSVDGVLSIDAQDSRGRTAGATLLSVGEHLVTLTATDTDGNTGTDSVLVRITDEDVDTELDSEADTDTDTDTEIDEGTDADTEPDTSPGGFDYGTQCGGIGVYDRIVPITRTGNLRRVAYAPSGDYALILEDDDTLLRFDEATSALTVVGEAVGEQWLTIHVDPAGFALVGGGTDTTNPSPRLHRYIDGVGLTPVSIPSSSDGGMIATTRIIAMDRRWDGVWAVLADNSASSNNILYMNELTLGATGDGIWSFGGATTSFQSATWRPVSVSWGLNLGTPVALAANRQVTTFLYDAALPNGRWSSESRGGLGNHGQIVFDPADHEVAWMINGSGNVYAWQGLMMGSGNQHDFGNITWNHPRRFTTSPDGAWKVFVGGHGMVAFSDSPWTPIDSTHFALSPVANWGSPPWSASGSQGFADVAWRPDSCGGLIVGDATQNRSMLVRWFMQ